MKQQETSNETEIIPEIILCDPDYTVEEMRAKIRELIGEETLREHKRLKAAGLLYTISDVDEDDGKTGDEFLIDEREDDAAGPEDDNPEGLTIDDSFAFP